MSLSGTAAPLLSQLNAQYEAGDVSGGQSTLTQIKILCLEASGSSNSETDIALVACPALELGVLLAVLEGDLEAFARNLAQLKPYYDQLPDSAETPRKAHVVGLNLMHLLVENRLAEFHAALELLTPSEASNPLVSFPIELERHLMVGLYDQVLAVAVPDPSFQFFVDHLLQTVRDNIADCMEVSYTEISLQAAQSMMKFDSQAELSEYIQDCRDDWIVQGSQLLFQPPSTGVQASTDIPSRKWIAQSLSYATEMERIV